MEAKLTKEDVGTASMSDIPPVIITNITNGENVELRFTTSAGNVDGEKYRPCYQAANKTDDDGNLEEAQEEVAVESMRVENVSIWNFVEATEPSKQLVAKLGRSFTVRHQQVSSKPR